MLLQFKTHNVSETFVSDTWFKLVLTALHIISVRVDPEKT